jgi:mannose/fructose/N-acetylgalactosamine-specific phosphotransferase system component IIC
MTPALAPPAITAVALLVGMACVVDRKAFGQFMLCRPIVAGPAVGWALGNAETGLWVGVPLELMFLSSASYGASTPENETLAAIVGACVQACLAPHLPLPEATGVSLALSLPVAALGRRIEAAFEHAYERIALRAQTRLASHHAASAAHQARKGLLVPALVGAAGVYAGVWLGRGAASFAPQLLAHRRPVLFVGAALVGLAAGVAARSIRVPRGKWLSWTGALLTATLMLWRGMR